MNEEHVSFTLRVPAWMNKRLVELAKRHKRSKNKEIELILEEFLVKAESSAE